MTAQTQRQPAITCRHSLCHWQGTSEIKHRAR
jgi:hypothetical protein